MNCSFSKRTWGRGQKWKFSTQVHSQMVNARTICVRERERFSDLVHGDDVSCYKLRAVDQAVCPAHLHHVSLCWRPESHTVSVLYQTKATLNKTLPDLTGYQLIEFRRSIMYAPLCPPGKDYR